MVSTQKKTQLSELAKLIQDRSNFFLVKIDKTSHQNLESLRRELRKNKSTLKVVKNSLLEKALNRLSTKNPSLKELTKKFFPLKDASGLVSLEKDWSAGLKAFYNFVQKEKTLSFKFSLLDNSLYSETDTVRIAELPSKEELVGKVIGSMKSPLNKLVYSLKYNANKFVYILQTKSKGGAK